MSGLVVRHATVDDAGAICSIYNHEVLHETSTFDLVPRSVEAQRAWIEARSGAFAALVAVDATGILVALERVYDARTLVGEIAPARNAASGPAPAR